MHEFPPDSITYIVGPIFVLPDKSMGDLIDVGQYNKCIVFAIEMEKRIDFGIKLLGKIFKVLDKIWKDLVNITNALIFSIKMEKFINFAIKGLGQNV